jgi:hypothetical protein
MSGPVFCRAFLAAACFLNFPVLAQVNCWTNPGSGYWEQPYWSAGAPPVPGQSVMLTNAGWKAVAVGPTTAQNYPSSLRPASIVIASPTNSYNVLLINYAGFQAPLVTGSLTVNSNSAVTIVGSALRVENTNSGNFSIGASFNHGDFSQVTGGPLKIGDVGPGNYYLTNGTLALSSATLGGLYSGTFRHYGGSASIGSLYVAPKGEYDLLDGQLSGSVTIAGLMTHSGGWFSGSMIVSGGSATQSGGTNGNGALDIGVPYNQVGQAIGGSYTLSNGLLNTTASSIHNYGVFNQSGGVHQIDGELYLDGDIVPPGPPGTLATATYNLSGGLLLARSTYGGLGSFVQTGGTNQVSGDLELEWTWPRSVYQLNNGSLVTSNTIIRPEGAGFVQAGGSHTIQNLLYVGESTSTGYTLSGGVLTTPNIQLFRSSFSHAGGTLNSQGSLSLSESTWRCNTGQQQLGTLGLGIGYGPGSAISMPSGSSMLRFTASAGTIWSNQATLTITGWNGSPSGGGLHQIIFGNSSSALTAQQLSQIQFANPNGVNGVYFATILPSGEIVPGHPLNVRVVPGAMVLTWGNGFTLQTSINVAGPYLDVTNAVSPFTNAFNEPKRFFRLR